MFSKLYKKFTFTNAYTLAEMSIVMLIISLLAVGITLGNRFYEQAKIQRVARDLITYRAAVINFKNKYAALPGDMSNASDIISGCTATCNGDGNERIDTDNETFRVWQQLSLAGFITKEYIGTNTNDILPKSTIDGGYFAVRTANISGLTKTFVEFGGMSSQTRGYADVSIIDPTNALFIDTKLDDGVADQGLVLGLTGLAPGTFAALPANSCSNSALSNADHYNTSNNGQIVCKMIYIIE
ncbi:MAG: type II secretion system protein [Sphingobacteriia bacterium]|nr:type II secretion system protein [Sphingobacteriia bacterium]